MIQPDLRAALVDGRLSVRAYNALVSSGILTFRQLGELGDLQLANLRGLGIKTLAEIRTVRDAPNDARIGQEMLLEAPSDSARSAGVTERAVADSITYRADPDWSFNVADDLSEALVRSVISRRTYNYLQSHGCRTIQDVARLANQPEGLKRGIGRQGRDHIGVLLASSTATMADVSAVPDERSLARITRRVRSVLSQNEWEIVVRRSNDTLREIASDRGVSRERVRQIESKAWRQVVAIAMAERELVAEWRAALERPAVAEGSLVDGHFSLPGDLIGQQQIVQVLLRILGAERPRIYGGRLSGFWTLHPGALLERLQRLVALVPCERDSLTTAIATLGLDPAVPVLDVLGVARSPARYVKQVDAWVRSIGRDRDCAWMVLQRRAAPAKLDDLARELGVPSHNLDAAMRRDDRFAQLLPSGLWTIRDWNLRESDYRSSLEAVRAVLTELGPQPLARLTRNVIARYSVTPAAVHQCLMHESIGRWADGRIDLTSNGAPHREESEPALPPSVFREEGGRVLAILKPVTRDLLRGSGLGLPRYVGWALGMRQAPQNRVFRTQEGELITVRKRIQGTNISTLRTFAEQLGASDGCDLVIRLDTTDDTVSVTLGCQRNCSHRRGRPIGDMERN